MPSDTHLVVHLTHIYVLHTVLHVGNIAKQDPIAYFYYKLLNSK